jgi:hypothetical protein
MQRVLGFLLWSMQNHKEHVNSQTIRKIERDRLTETKRQRQNRQRERERKKERKKVDLK